MSRIFGIFAQWYDTLRSGTEFFLYQNLLHIIIDYSMINLNRNERNPYISGCIWVRESFMVSFHSIWNSILVYLLQIFWNHQSMSQTIPFIQRVKLWNEQKNYNLTLPIFLMSSLFICHFKNNKAKNSRRVSS